MTTRLEPREEERALFSRLRETARALGVRAWVVGGYVRDRLLEREPGRELDLALSGTDGLAFARALGADAHPHGHSGPAAHLRNGQALIGAVHIDFARLRRESYGDSSRIPALTGGEATLAEDAARRDFTINALYLDLEDGRIADPCGGLSDLDARRLRTPIDAIASLHQDPLRFLRGVRFAAQLDFTLEPEWLVLTARPERERLAELFERKLAPVRVREELFGKPGGGGKLGALTGRGAARALQMLASYAPIARWLGEAHPEALERLRRLESLESGALSYEDRVAQALLALLGDDAEDLLQRLLVARPIAQRVIEARALEQAWAPRWEPAPRELRAALYRGGLGVADALRLATVERKDLAERVARAREEIADGPPLGATELLARGWRPGRELGVALERVREAWLDQPSLGAAGALALLAAEREDAPPTGAQS